VKIRKAVITAAGLGTRLLPATKETPKEMLPLFVRDECGGVCLKPLLQIVFEQLYGFGVRDFCFIVGKSKRSIEDHFTPDAAFIDELSRRSKPESVKALKKFYAMLNDSEIVWKNQPYPKGFGDAVSLAKKFVGEEPFMVYAGDTFIISDDNDFLNSLSKVHSSYKAKASLLCERVQDPERFGVIVGTEVSKGIYKVDEIVEKPKTPPSNVVAAAIYIFDPAIFESLEKVSCRSGEKELTDAIQKLVEQGRSVYAVELTAEEERLDIGTSEAYKLALDRSYDWAKRVRS